MLQALTYRHVDNIYLSAAENCRVPSIELPDLQTLGGRVTYGRSLRGFSQSELARRAHCSQPTIWALENNDTKEVTAKLLDSVSRALDLPWEFLLRGTDLGTTVDAAVGEAELVAIHRALTPPARFSLLEFGRHLKSSPAGAAAESLSDAEAYKRATSTPRKTKKASRKSGT